MVMSLVDRFEGVKSGWSSSCSTGANSSDYPLCAAVAAIYLIVTAGGALANSLNNSVGLRVTFDFDMQRRRGACHD